MSEIIIDVREIDEYVRGHVKDSIHVPLSQFANIAPGVLSQHSDRKVVFMCHSGMRATQAANHARGLGYNVEHTYEVYPGGIVAWMNAGKPVESGMPVVAERVVQDQVAVADTVTEKSDRSVMPLFRQLQIAMGGLVALFAALGIWVDPMFSLGTLFLGSAILFTGLTGGCSLAHLLAMAPWNRSAPELKKAYCQNQAA